MTVLKHKIKFILPLAVVVVFLSLNSSNRNESNVKHKTNLSLQNTFNDGPYVLFRNDSIVELKISDNEVIKTILNPDSVKTRFVNEVTTYENIERIAVLSDIHGQYNLTTTILNNNGILDEHLNWNFADGHLVIVGDIFDRGEQVTELLWLVYKLEQQAEIAGGKVHFTLGNHEYMVMLNDLRYINRKYKITQQLLQIPYNELYNENSLMGRWLRSKNTVLKINDHLFVHGGISLDFIEDGFDLEKTNALMRESLNSEISPTIRDSIYNKFYNSSGPIWYRGYFTDSLKVGDIKKLLRKLKVNQIVVGHTSHSKIEAFFDSRIFVVDTSIKNGIYGEILFIENGKYYRGTMEGKREALN